MEGYSEKVLGAEDYMAGYEKSAKEARYNKNVEDFEKLCYQALETNKAGKKLIEYLKKHYVLAPTPGHIGQDYGDACIYHEGLRQGYRLLINGVESYKMRMQSEKNTELNV
jgi:hypothetical protein